MVKFKAPILGYEVNPDAKCFLYGESVNTNVMCFPCGEILSLADNPNYSKIKTNPN
jgi:hypothetical protein